MGSRCDLPPAPARKSTSATRQTLLVPATGGYGVTLSWGSAMGSGKTICWSARIRAMGWNRMLLFPVNERGVGQVVRIRGREPRRTNDGSAPSVRGGERAGSGSATEAHSGSPNIAVVTMTRDEGQMLKRWVSYYGEAVGRSNLVIFDDNSVDGSTDNLDCTVHRLPKFPGGKKFIPARMKLANGIAAGLLACYDYVIFADVDEFLIPDPDEFDGLLDFIRARPNSDVIAGMALNVVHHAGVEGDIDPERPILDQRSFAKFIPRMCKPSIKRIPAQWRRSTHAITAPYRVDPGLFMAHMKFYDHESLRELGDRRRALFKADARGFNSSWKLTGSEIAKQVTDGLAGPHPDEIAEFIPDPQVLEQLVLHRDDYYESGGAAQMKAMRDEPLVRIPKRLRGLV